MTQSAKSELIGTCRAHGHWFPVDRVHEPCPEPGCQAACDYYALLSDAELLARTECIICECAPCECRPIIGNCSKCGEVREDEYTCRGGGHTILKEASDAT